MEQWLLSLLLFLRLPCSWMVSAAPLVLLSQVALSSTNSCCALSATASMNADRHMAFSYLSSLTGIEMCKDPHCFYSTVRWDIIKDLNIVYTAFQVACPKIATRIRTCANFQFKIPTNCMCMRRFLSAIFWTSDLNIV